MLFTKNSFKEVRKRDGRIVPFDETRIVGAVSRAMQVTGEGKPKDDAEKVADQVVGALTKKFPKDHVPTIEEIQDAVETQLILMDFPKTAKAYILYRKDRAEIREKRMSIPEHVARLAAESKTYFKNVLAEFVYYRTYSRWIEAEGRRETWIETVDRYIEFMKENLGEKLTVGEYEEIRGAILKQEAMPSMRLLQFAGRAARATNVCAFNCSYVAPTKPGDFAEIMYISMCGTGVGFSVESQTVQALPQIKKQVGKKLSTHVIEDSKEGWCGALTLGLETWFGGKDIEFDYSQLRPAGARLKTMGGKSSGPEPLRALLTFARKKILARQGSRLSNIDVHDLCCKIGEVVVAGGVRRSAMISLSDLDDHEMRAAKTGQFYIMEPQRTMANNSAVYAQKPPAAQFLEEWLTLAKSGTGERGIFNRGGVASQIPERRRKILKSAVDKVGTNPCVTGDTLVYVADGRGNVPIKKLAEEGQDVPVFCLNDKWQITIRQMRNPRLTGGGVPIYKIYLDDGSTLKTTANHKLRMKTGEYKEARQLERGDSAYIATRFEASIKDIFPEANSRSQNYWWINNGKSNNKAEHRLIAEFHCNTKIPAGSGFVVHHRNRNAQNNSPDNLEIMTKETHDALHGALMAGNNNPMRRVANKWSEEQWAEYKAKHSVNNRGAKNKRFSGFTHEELKENALVLAGNLGRRFSSNDWVKYAKENDLPQSFSKWRKDHLGGIVGLAKWATSELGLEQPDADPRVVKSYKKYTALGYNCEIIDGRLQIIKLCEECGVEFKTTISAREYGICSISCGLKKKWRDEKHRSRIIDLINHAHATRKEQRREVQAQTFSDLRFKLERAPKKDEWMAACKENHVSPEISRSSSPFRKYADLKEYAESYNHKVVAVEFSGYADVYNGTVDEFHNFFVGGFASKTRSGKRKFVYLNNLQCGEILLQPKEFCNLSEVVARPEDTEATLMEKTRIATILGTYQSTLTNFPFLSKEWKKNCEEERLLGVSVTGQWDCPAVRNENVLRKLRDYSIEVNKTYAARFGVNPSASITCVKPSGNLSQTVDTSSGLHPRHSQYYIRRVRIASSDALFQMLKDQKVPYSPEVGQSAAAANTFVFEFPIKSPEGAVTKNDLTALDQLEYWKKVKANYCEHNPSVTISVGDNEWIAVADWLYENWDMLGGLSFLPREEHSYLLAPYEEITKERYEEMAAKLPQIDFSQILLYEQDDSTDMKRELACVGGVCEIEEVTRTQ